MTGACAQSACSAKAKCKWSKDVLLLLLIFLFPPVYSYLNMVGASMGLWLSPSRYVHYMLWQGSDWPSIDMAALLDFFVIEICLIGWICIETLSMSKWLRYPLLYIYIPYALMTTLSVYVATRCEYLGVCAQ